MPNKILSVLAHPMSNSFCGALFTAFNEALCEKQSPSSCRANVQRINLYEQSFDPVLGASELLRHIPLDEASISLLRELQDCTHLAFFFPDWWGAEPAILKGLIDRLFRAGVVFERADYAVHTQGAQTAGRMHGCGLSLWITSDTPQEGSEHVRQGYEHRFAHIAEFCAFRSVDLFFHSPVRGSSLGRRRSWLGDCASYARSELSKLSKGAGRSSESR